MNINCSNINSNSKLIFVLNEIFEPPQISTHVNTFRRVETIAVDYEKNMGGGTRISSYVPHGSPGNPWLSIAFRKGKPVVGDITVNGGDTGRGVVGGGAG